MKRSRVISATLVAFSIAAALSGCAPADGLDIFDRAQVASDELPGTGTEKVFADLDPESTRFLWQNDDVVFYAAKGSGDSPGNTCLVTFKAGEGSSGCSTNLPLTVQFNGMPTYMLNDLSFGGDDWTKVADYLFVESA